MRTGLTAYDPAKACPGFVLYCPSYCEGKAHLIDLQGSLIHQWQLPYWPNYWGYLLPNGNLFYMGRLSHDPDGLPGWRAEIGGALIEVDWDNNIVWEHHDHNQRLDARRTSSGGAIYLTVELVPEEVSGQVRGGIPLTDEEGMRADLILEVDSSGNRIWEWHAYEHLDFDRHLLPPNVQRHEWSCANTIVPLDDERVLVSFRHISTIAIINKVTGDIAWSIGHEVVSGQHDASLLPNGHILAFDNGVFRSDTNLTFSRVVEIDPTNNEVVWKYTDSPAQSFYSPFISGAQRLSNGNTLITEGLSGRMFQVTSGGEIVWEYINPHFTKGEESPSFYNAVFRARHYLPEEIPALG
jgi:hypothetical protein